MQQVKRGQASVAGEPRTQVCIKLSVRERDAWNETAVEHGVTLSEFIRKNVRSFIASERK